MLGMCKTHVCTDVSSVPLLTSSTYQVDMKVWTVCINISTLSADVRAASFLALQTFFFFFLNDGLRLELFDIWTTSVQMSFLLIQAEP